MTRRRGLWWGAIGCGVAALTAGHLVDQWRLRGELWKIAQETSDALTTGNAAYDTATVVTASRTYLIFGPAHGKVGVYTRSREAEPRYTGVDYFLERTNGEWKIVESGLCEGEECRLRAKDAFNRNMP